MHPLPKGYLGGLELKFRSFRGRFYDLFRRVCPFFRFINVKCLCLGRLRIQNIRNLLFDLCSLLPRRERVNINNEKELTKHMAVLFSAVTLTANDQQTEFFVGGIPREFDDLEGWTAFDNFIAYNNNLVAYQNAGKHLRIPLVNISLTLR